MFGKKNRIKKYLTEKSQDLHNQFDYVLEDFISKQLKKKLSDIGLSKMKFMLIGIQDSSVLVFKQ
jgi:hypothetical protein